MKHVRLRLEAFMEPGGTQCQGSDTMRETSVLTTTRFCGSRICIACIAVKRCAENPLGLWQHSITAGTAKIFVHEVFTSTMGGSMKHRVPKGQRATSMIKYDPGNGERGLHDAQWAPLAFLNVIE